MTLQLHYRGDVTPFDGSQVLGPDRDSGLYKAITATYDPDVDVTTVTLRPLTMDERHDYVQKQLAQQETVETNPLVGRAK